jgi:hypothetical protein
MASRPADFKSDASTGFATQACAEAYAMQGAQKKGSSPN